MSLCGQHWTVRPVGDVRHMPAALHGRGLPATVPGCVHTDLLAARLIGHPNVGYNERECAWIGKTDWQYCCTFEPDAGLLSHERIDLVCDGLDTIATVELNGQVVGTAANMHHLHRFDVREALTAGANKLAITFRAPLAHAQEEVAARGPRPVNGDWGPYAYIRKMACNFGWDWGPQVPTSGIWRAIGLQAWSGVRLAGVRPLTRRADSDENWVVDARVSLEWADPQRPLQDVHVQAQMREGSHVHAAGVARATPGSSEVAVQLSVEQPELWWPRGHGGQRLHPLEISLHQSAQPADDALDTWTTRIGFRTVRLNTEPDEHGSAFTLEVNGKPIFCQGADWIPDALFPSEMTPKCYRTRIRQAADANMNMLRVWGGGIYEDRAFYDTCDELGLLVWQDFMFACATYPEEQPYWSSVEAEARHNIARLSTHPSVVLWCGGNECIWAYMSWGFKQLLQPGQTWGINYYLDLLPRLVAELDPTRPYWPNSPYSGSPDRDPLDVDHGNRHTWDVQIEGYRQFVPRFVSEFGHQSPPAYATLCEALPGEELEINSKAMRHRQRAMGGNTARYEQPLDEWFPEPASFDDWHYLAQLLQARAISLAIEWLRAHMPRCMGVLYWQLNDCWAGHSWSAIDWRGRRKPLWYATRRSCAPRLLTIHPIAEHPTLFAVNDTEDPWEGVAHVRRLRFDGTVLAQGRVPIALNARASTAVSELFDVVGEPVDTGSELLVAEIDSRRALHFFEHDKGLAYPPPRYTANVTRTDSGCRVELNAETLIRDAVLAIDRLDPDAQVSENLVTLLPGESLTFDITSSANLSADALTKPPFLTCANRFGVRRH